jgi:hypothetical protein
MLFVHVPTNDDEKNTAQALSSQMCRSLGLPLPVACEEDWTVFWNTFTIVWFPFILQSPEGGTQQ